MKKVIAITIGIINLIWIVIFIVAISTSTDKEIMLVLYIIHLFNKDIKE